ncbi:type II toxin-antitoxin system RelE/ParE family toxin [Bordetella genomosp. 13]|uniref:type II toxin-antitoxin system RelE/ParE family toxin n=1 Tax=Bordetella genomosp. 13 TaxID=463040 RepID=UPI0011A5B9EA|nr:type II toxin-antitoxin system RelE/ParE family toxin [Bordetella genomosp. 13]
MIKTFRHKGIEDFFLKGSKARITAAHAAKLRLQLAALHSATSLEDLAAPANWRLHLLIGKNPKGQSVDGHHAFDVSGNWRSTFRFEGTDVVLVDYH